MERKTGNGNRWRGTERGPAAGGTVAVNGSSAGAAPGAAPADPGAVPLYRAVISCTFGPAPALS